MSKRLWKYFTKSIICSTSELNDNKKNLHALRWDKKIEECQFNLTSIRQSITLNQTRNDYSHDHSSIVNQLCTNQLFYWHSSIVIDWNIWSIVYMTFQFIFDLNFMRVSFCSITRQKRIKIRIYNKRLKKWISISQSTKYEIVLLLTRQEVEVCWCKKCWFAHFINYLKILFKNRRTIHIACSLRIRIHLICNHVKSNRCFRMSSTHAISNTFSQFRNLIQIRITSYFNTTISFAFETIEFEIFKFIHVRENLSRQFSILIHFLISRFLKISSTLFNSRTLSKAFCHLLNWQLNHIKCLESWKRMKIFILRKYWFEEVLKVLCFRIFH